MAGSRVKGIMIEIDGETKGLDKALSSVNSNASKTNSELRDVNKLLKLDPGNTELVAQKQQLLAKAVNNTEDKLQILKNAQKDVQDAFERGEIGEDKYRAFQRELQATETELKSVKTGLKDTSNFMENSADEAGRLEAGFRKTGKATDEMNDHLNEVEKSVKWQNVVDGAQAAADGIKDFAGKAMEAWAETDDAVDNMTAKTGATGKAADALADSYKEVMDSMPIDDTQDLSNTMAGLKNQFDVSDESLTGYSKKMMEFSAVTGQSGEEAVTGLHDAMAKFQLGADQLPSVMDAFTAASQRSGVPVKDLEEQASKAAPTFKEMGVSLQDGVGILAAWSKGGVDGTVALTGMTKASVNYAKDNKTLKDGLTDTFNAIKDAKAPQDAMNAAVEAFGAKSGPQMLQAIQDGKVGLDDLQKSVDGTSGALSKSYNQTLDPADKLKVAQQQLNEVMAGFGDDIQSALLPVIKTLAPIVKKAAEAFSNLSPGIKTAIVIVGALVVAFAAIAPIIAGLIASFTVIAGVLSGPIIAVIAGVIAAIGAAIAIFTNWGSIVNWLETVWATLVVNAQYIFWQISQTISTVFNGISSFISNVWNSIVNFVTSLWNGMVNTVQAVFSSISQTISNVFNGVSSFISNVWNGISNAISSVLSGIRTTITNVWNNIRNAISNIMNGISNVISSVWNGITNTISNVVNGIRSTISNVFGGIAGIVRGAFDGARNAASDVLNGMWNIISGIVDRIKSVFNFRLKFPDIDIPKIPLPHFKLSGEFNPLKGKIPKLDVDWYAKGGIFTKPTLFATDSGIKGVGEAGPEAVLPLNRQTLAGIGAGIAAEMGGNQKPSVVINQTIVAKDSPSEYEVRRAALTAMKQVGYQYMGGVI